MDATTKDFGPIMQAVAVMNRARRMLSGEQRVALLEISDRLLDVLEAERRWSRLPGAPEEEEPLAAKRALDEIRATFVVADVLDGSDGERQFFRRTLRAVLALTTKRYTILQRAGRLGDPSREPSAEDAAMVLGFVAAFERDGFHGPVEGGAAVREAFTSGKDGGRWALYLLSEDA